MHRSSQNFGGFFFWVVVFGSSGPKAILGLERGRGDRIAGRDGVEWIGGTRSGRGYFSSSELSHSVFLCIHISEIIAGTGFSRFHLLFLNLASACLPINYVFASRFDAIVASRGVVIGLWHAPRPSLINTSHSGRFYPPPSFEGNSRCVCDPWCCSYAAPHGKQGHRSLPLKILDLSHRLPASNMVLNCQEKTSRANSGPRLGLQTSSSKAPIPSGRPCETRPTGPISKITCPFCSCTPCSPTSPPAPPCSSDIPRAPST